MLGQIWWRWRYGWLALAVLLGIWLVTPQGAPAEIVRVFSEDSLEAYQLTRLSGQDEVALGQVIDAQFKAEGLALYTDNPAVAAYVEQVGQQLVSLCDSQTALPYRFQTVVDQGANAFATMGGFIYVQTGLLKVAENEAELAFVLAHEIGHIVERHGVNRLWQELTTQELDQTQRSRQQTLVKAGSQLRLLSRTLEDEYTADDWGLQCLRQAGYAQSAPTALLQRMRNADTERSQPDLFVFLGSRINQLARLLTPLVVPESTAGLDPAAYQERIGDL